jgi:tRNA dimethylallyltransferase
MQNRDVPIVCLMGPTAAGKTPLAVELAQQFPCEIISVDSAMVYRGMDIGTAKPDADILKVAPHHLIDIRDPADSYSAGQFRTDALREINAILARGKIPLLVGGSMMYFRILQQGLAALPTADVRLRTAMQIEAEQVGWPVLHAKLATIDPLSAQRIHPNDSQRIQRALEVFMLSGKTLTAWQAEDTSMLGQFRVCNIAIAPADRKILHQRIALRFADMLQLGFLEEVKTLRERGDLSKDLPSMRSVGYRQMWDYLDGDMPFELMCEKAIAATRQLAKRQLTWLRSWPEVTWLETDSPALLTETVRFIQTQID